MQNPIPKCVAVATILALLGTASPVLALARSYAGTQMAGPAVDPFAAVSPDVDGVRRISEDRLRTGRIELRHLPASLRRPETIRVRVPAGADRLAISVISDEAGRGVPRLRLVDPDGERFAPGRRGGNRYDGLRDVEAVRRASGDEMPGFGELFGSPAGSWIRDRATGNLIVEIKDPTPGVWRVRVTTPPGGVAAAVTVAATNRAELQETVLECARRPAAAAAADSLCRTVIRSVLSLAKAAAIYYIGSVVLAGSSPFLVGGVVAWTAVDVTITLGEVVRDLLFEYGFLSRPAAKAAWDYVGTDVITALAGVQIAQLAPQQVLFNIANFLSRVFFTNLARLLCEFFGLESIVGIVDEDMPLGYVGVNYTHRFKAFNAKRGLDWSITRGSLPAGLALDRTGKLTGAPLEIGRSSFTVSLDDPNGTAARTFEIYVYADNDGKGPDLVPELLAPNSVVGGDELLIGFGVRNQGDLAAPVGSVALFYGSSKKLAKRSALAALEDYHALAPGEEAFFSANVRLPEYLERGDKLFVSVVVDYHNTAKEKKPRGGNGEKNNKLHTLVAVSEKAPYQVLTPGARDKLEPGETTRITWQNPDGNLSEVRIRLLQDGRRRGVLFTGDVGIGGAYEWEVGDTHTGEGFTIEVESLTDPEAWAASKVFSIVVPDLDLSGNWRVTRTVSGDDPVVSENETTVVEVRHDIDAEIARVYFGGDYIGAFEVIDGAMRALDLQGDVPQNGSGSIWVGNMLAAPNVVEISSNAGSYDAKRFDVSTTVVYHIEGVGPRISVTFGYRGVKQK